MRTARLTGRPMWSQLYLPRSEIQALAGAYLGASRSRENLKNWAASRGDADSDSIYDLPELRRRSSDLARNNPLACAAIETNTTCVIGSGLRLQANIDRAFLGLSDEEADAWEATVEREFEAWWMSPESDSGRLLSGPEREELAFRASLERGDCFVLVPNIDGRGPYSTCVQTLEADLCSNPDGKGNTDTLMDGIEHDANGAPVAYHFSDYHPGSSVRLGRMKWTRVPAFGATGRRNVIHLYAQKRPGQTRGIPYLAPVISDIKSLGTYTDAEITNAIVSGFFNMVIETEDGSVSFAAPSTESSEAGRAAAPQLRAGGVIGLGPGEKATSIDPSRPSSSFEPFVLAITRWIGAALQIPFEILIKHFTASFSASQAAMLEAWRYFIGRRLWMVHRYKTPIYETWMTEAVLSGRIRAPGFIGGDPAYRHAYLGATWIGQPKGMINEKDQTDAMEKRLALAITSVSEEAAAVTGEDWEARLPRILRERRMLTEAGFPVPGAKPAANPAGASAAMRDLLDSYA